MANLHPDLLFEDQNGAIIHAEIHGYAMADFACRNLIYYGLLLRDYGQHPVQIVFWVGKDRLGVGQGLSNPPRLEYSYPVLDVRDIDAKALLAGGGISESIFAILCKMDSAREVIGEILRRVSELQPVRQREAIVQLLVLSGLRDLKRTVQEEVSRMPLSFDIHENEFLEEIYQDGLAKGRVESVRQVLLRLLEQKFGSLTAATADRVMNAPAETLMSWSDRVIGSASLDEVFKEN